MKRIPEILSLSIVRPTSDPAISIIVMLIAGGVSFSEGLHGRGLEAVGFLVGSTLLILGGLRRLRRYMMAPSGLFNRRGVKE